MIGVLPVNVPKPITNVNYRAEKETPRKATCSDICTHVTFGKPDRETLFFVLVGHMPHP